MKALASLILVCGCFLVRETLPTISSVGSNNPSFEARETDRALPDSVPEFFKNLLTAKGWELRKGDLTWGTFYPVKNLASVATEEQVKNGLTMDDLTIGQVVGVLELPQEVRDYRNLPVPAGIYSLRLGCQPESDDHRDTAPGRFFYLLCPMAKETKEIPPDAKALLERGKIESRKHPIPWFAFLGKPGETEKAALQKTPPKHESLIWPQAVDASGTKAQILLGWTIHGPNND